jgi:hypothetical protein
VATVATVANCGYMPKHKRQRQTLLIHDVRYTSRRGGTTRPRLDWLRQCCATSSIDPHGRHELARCSGDQRAQREGDKEEARYERSRTGFPFRSPPSLFLGQAYYSSCLLLCRSRLQSLPSGVLWSPGDTDKFEEDGKVHEERRHMRDPVARPARSSSLDIVWTVRTMDG